MKKMTTSLCRSMLLLTCLLAIILVLFQTVGATETSKNGFAIPGTDFFSAIRAKIQNHCNVTKAFRESGIVPDVIQQAPRALADVQFADGLGAELGNQLTQAQASAQPRVEWEARPGKLYTLAMVDADGQFLHWLLVDVPNGKDIAKGQVLANYFGPAPPAESGPHRYIILIYEQRDKLDQEVKRVDSSSKFSEFAKAYQLGQPVAVDSRIQFNISEFAKDYRLGQPMAGNFFITQNPPVAEQ